jgi:hypothetical protein
MNRMSWVTGGLVGAMFGAALGGCSPSVTVSRDEAAGQGGVGGSSPGGAGSGGGATGGASSGSGGTDGGGTGGGGTGGVVTLPEQGGAGGTIGGSGGTLGNEGGDDGIGGSGGTANAGAMLPEECPCTRRPGATPSRICPRGSGTSTSSTVGPEGGTVSLSGTTATIGVPFRVEVFAGSLPAPTELTLTELAAPPPAELNDVSPVYRLEPDGVDFVNGGEVSIPWTVPSGIVPNEIAVYHSDSVDGPYTRLADSYLNAGFSQATLLRSGYFLTAYPRTSAHAACP